jgi:hypothetical protein
MKARGIDALFAFVVAGKGEGMVNTANNGLLVYIRMV